MSKYGTFEDFYKIFKNWSKKDILRRTYDIAQESIQKENIIKEVRELFYEKCRIKDSDGRYSFNETDIDEFRNLLEKEVN